jgi:hypothetical protein
VEDLIRPEPRPLGGPFDESLYRIMLLPLLRSWQPPGPFVAAADRPWFYCGNEPALTPDVLVSLDVEEIDPNTPEGLWYLQWRYGKIPDLVIEFVRERGREADQLRRYARQGLPFYVIYDPLDLWGAGLLRAFVLHGGRYVSTDPMWFDGLGIGLRLWEGEYRGIRRTWPRWCDQEGDVLPTGEDAHR